MLAALIDAQRTGERVRDERLYMRLPARKQTAGEIAAVFEQAFRQSQAATKGK